MKTAARVSYLALLIPFMIISVSVGLLLTPTLDLPKEVITGVIYDLTLTSPIIYLIAIWNRPISKLTAVPVFIGGIIVATLIIPKEEQYHLDIVKTFVLPLVELAVISIVLYNIRKATKLFNSQNRSADFYNQFRQTAIDLLENKRFANVLATEVAMIYYALINWKTTQPAKHQFTYHKESGTLALYGAIIMILLVETIGLHFLLIQWSEVVAWILFILSLYTTLQVLGHAKAMKRRFIEVTNDSLILKYGLFGDAVIPLYDIENITITSIDFSEDEVPKVARLSLLGELEGHNTVIHLKQPHEITGAYGFKKRGEIILLNIDQKIELQHLLESSISI